MSLQGLAAKNPTLLVGRRKSGRQKIAAPSPGRRRRGGPPFDEGAESVPARTLQGHGRDNPWMAVAAGEDPGIGVVLADVFAWDIDFDRDTR